MASQDKHPLKDYSLWLVPSGSSYDTAQQVIDDLMKFEADSPHFEPHITLHHPVPKGTPLESITETLKSIVSKLPSIAKPLELSLKPAQKGTFYYQSVLAPVEPTEPLLQLRKACEDAFGELKPYFPHLSLLYGDLTPERRDELAKTVQDDMNLPTSVTVKEILVVDCTGVTSEWKTVARIPLQ